jgi:hypothetical protein
MRVSPFLLLMGIVLEAAFIKTMSQAFVKESEEPWLPDVAPTLQALIVFLTRENNGVRVYEQKGFIDANGREVHQMSNGLSYAKDIDGRWEVVL